MPSRVWRKIANAAPSASFQLNFSVTRSEALRATQIRPTLKSNTSAALQLEIRVGCLSDLSETDGNHGGIPCRRSISFG